PPVKHKIVVRHFASRILHANRPRIPHPPAIRRHRKKLHRLHLRPSLPQKPTGSAQTSPANLSTHAATPARSPHASPTPPASETPSPPAPSSLCPLLALNVVEGCSSLCVLCALHSVHAVPKNLPRNRELSANSAAPLRPLW